MRKLKLSATFYSTFAFASNLITLSCLFLISLRGEKGIYVIQILFWFKIFTLGAIFYFISNYKKNDFNYYKNLGLTKNQLWISTLTFDFVLFLLLILLTLKFV